ncbi:hypothetical protein F2Q69_00062007 [Brassica cretica]|uniref:Uncharacterized protein n=1 Tax=Brassica cretica TaxID=69181 RepID=A0A8S9RLI9_BRACR|nr:hypothetical protein F2Q69_00062007 [Brassica cretica]
MFNPEEKKEIFGRWVFMIRYLIKLTSIFPLFSIFFKKSDQPTRIVHDIS